MKGTECRTEDQTQSFPPKMRLLFSWEASGLTGCPQECRWARMKCEGRVKAQYGQENPPPPQDNCRVPQLLFHLCLSAQNPEGQMSRAGCYFSFLLNIVLLSPSRIRKDSFKGIPDCLEEYPGHLNHVTEMDVVPYTGFTST